MIYSSEQVSEREKDGHLPSINQTIQTRNAYRYLITTLLYRTLLTTEDGLTKTRKKEKKNQDKTKKRMDRETVVVKPDRSIKKMFLSCFTSKRKTRACKRT